MKTKTTKRKVGGKIRVQKLKRHTRAEFLERHDIHKRAHLEYDVIILVRT